MALGSSAGRSSGNRMGEGARRKGTDRERAAIDPPQDQMVNPNLIQANHLPQLRVTPRGQLVLNVVALTLWIMLSVVLGVLVSAWWGLI